MKDNEVQAWSTIIPAWIGVLVSWWYARKAAMAATKTGADRSAVAEDAKQIADAINALRTSQQVMRSEDAESKGIPVARLAYQHLKWEHDRLLDVVRHVREDKGPPFVAMDHEETIAQLHEIPESLRETIKPAYDFLRGLQQSVQIEGQDSYGESIFANWPDLPHLENGLTRLDAACCALADFLALRGILPEPTAPSRRR